LFRDNNCRRNGFALRNTGIQHADRLSRLLLILALAYILLPGIGLHAKRNYHPSSWCTNTRRSACGVYTIGRRMVDRIQIPPHQSFAELQAAIWEASPHWG
jgi:hypothetical protein